MGSPWQISTHATHTPSPWLISTHAMHTPSPWLISTHPTHTPSPVVISTHTTHTPSPRMISSHPTHSCLQCWATPTQQAPMSPSLASKHPPMPLLCFSRPWVVHE